ncbi:MAG: BatA domain-containing protein [Gemmatimonadaceae bacterium]
MIWQNAWALAGLFALALPVLIHMLSRKQAMVQKFPTLRFLDVSRLLPTRSPRLSDFPLLVVRLGILAAAVLALAQPLWLSSARQRAFNSTITRAIIVDTSTSMMRKNANGARAIDSALAQSASLAAQAQRSTVMQSASPTSALSEAIAWLSTQDGRGEIDLLSDFQMSSVDSASLASIPKQYGVHFVRSVFVNDSASSSIVAAASNVSVTVDSTNTNAEWTLRSNADIARPILLFTSASQRQAAELTADATITVTAASLADTAKPVAIVFPEATERAAFVRDAKAMNASWMADVIASVSENELLNNAARTSHQLKDTVVAGPFVTLVRTSGGAPIVWAASVQVNGKTRLAFFARTAPASFTSAALIAALSKATARSATIAESDQSSLSNATLKYFERAPADVSLSAHRDANGSNSNASDGRWFWALVLLLLVVETLMRRNASNDRVMEVA